MKHLMYIVNRIRINKRTILATTCRIVCFVFTIWGFVSLFDPLDGVLGTMSTVGCKILFGSLVLLFVAILSTILATYYVLLSNKRTVFSTKTDHKIIVQYGDVNSPDVIEKGYVGRRNIVVSVNRCFDTIVDDNLVSRTSQHGRVMSELYNSNKYDENSLNQALQQSLCGIQCEVLTPKVKPKGNLNRYPCGTVAELNVSDSLTYFFLGLSAFDNQLTARTTKAEYVLAFQKLMEFCDAHSQGYPVVLHLMGTGLSRANISHEEAINYMISAMRINNDMINCDFHIVVWEGMKDKLSIENVLK